MDRTEYLFSPDQASLPTELKPEEEIYTEALEKVIDSERPYLDARRKTYGENRPGDTEESLEDLWGLTISGGGIRAATLGLGMLQRLIEQGLLQKVDYLSTVSGGGFIGSCFSTLMNTSPDKFVQPPDHQAAKAKAKVPGLTPTTSPLLLLMPELPAEANNGDAPELVTAPGEKADEARSRSFTPGMLDPELVGTADVRRRMDLSYKSQEGTRIDARHQLHHLRTHGEYLTPDKNFLSPDVQRAIGTVLAGILHNLLLFTLVLTAIVAAHYLLFDQVSDGDFFTLMYEFTETEAPLNPAFEYLTVEQRAGLTDSWRDRIMVYISLVKGKAWSQPWIVLGMFLAGLLFGIGYVRKSRLVGKEIMKEEAAIRNREKESPGKAGRDVKAHLEYHFLARFNRLSIAFPIALLLLIFGIGNSFHWLGEQAYWLIFSLPFFAGLGIFVGVYSLTALIGYPDDQPRVARGLLGALRGGAFYALMATLVVPSSLLFVFSAVNLINPEFVLDLLVSSGGSVVASVIAYLASMTKKKEGQNESMFTNIINKLKTPLLSLSAALFVLFSAIPIVSGLRSAYFMLPQHETFWFPLWVMLAALTIFLALGYFVDTNKLSLHYFYRDRLSEAYLRTDGRVLRSKGMDRQGMASVNLRDDENLRLKDLGWTLLAPEEAGPIKVNPAMHPDCRLDAKGRVWRQNARGPYHLIVTALNLQGSEELVRKDLKSDHFLFSRNYVGSASTGYVKTGVYREGETKLARAMTISAAAVSSGMGFSSFLGQSFFTTLLNLRLGYWMENPWYYRFLQEGRPVHSPTKYRQLKRKGWQDFPKKDPKEAGYRLYYNPKRKHTFWPIYLLREMLGLNTASKRMINVSDGGHTGDNLGLLPLLQRRCRVIIACDFEQDNRFTFESFNHAVRMANIEENIEIQIDLRPLVPKDVSSSKIDLSQQSVVKGRIIYPDFTEGILYYIKSSVRQTKTGEKDGLPINVYNYYKLHPDFPHQSTADQYFDDAQFEAYRRLGFYMGKEATELIHQQLNKEKE